MKNRVEKPNWAFVVQRSDDNGNDLGSYVLEQFVSPGPTNAALERMRNQVEAHLCHQFRRHGTHAYVIYEGTPESAAAFVVPDPDFPF